MGARRIEVLRAISMDIAHNETVFLSGASGAGKSGLTAEGRDGFNEMMDASLLRDRSARPFLREVQGYYVGEEQQGVFPLYRSAEDQANGGQPLLVSRQASGTEDRLRRGACC